MLLQERSRVRLCTQGLRSPLQGTPLPEPFVVCLSGSDSHVSDPIVAPSPSPLGREPLQAGAWLGGLSLPSLHPDSPGAWGESLWGVRHPGASMFPEGHRCLCS